MCPTTTARAIVSMLGEDRIATSPSSSSAPFSRSSLATSVKITTPLRFRKDYMLRRDLLKSTVASVAGALALAPAGGAEAAALRSRRTTGSTAVRCRRA